MLPNVLQTSATDHVPVLAEEVRRLLAVRPNETVVDGTFTGGGITSFDAAKGATGLGAINSSVPAADVTKVNDVLTQLKSGSITPPDTVP